ncbi:MAG: AMP nucleosidase [Bdellovibrionales bacterium]|nr:AMP nucleosidase [Bdellovibrionales bacterium]
MSKNLKTFFPTEPARPWNNPEKKRIARDMLERYTGSPIDEICSHIILSNFDQYINTFSERSGQPIHQGSACRIVNNPDIDVSLLDFNIGSPMSALVIEMLAGIEPAAVLMAGMCGGLHRDIKIGDFFVPMAAIRDEGTSIHYMPAQVPALPAFKIQKFLSQVIVEKGESYVAGVVHTTDYRFWEFDEHFKQVLKQEKAAAIDMETATLFVAAFACKIPCGALLLVSDLPLIEPKTKAAAKKVFSKYTNLHLDIAIEAMTELEERGDQVRHFEW